MSQGNRDKQPLMPLNDKLKNIIDRAKMARESFSSACICRVPAELRKLKESAYTPRLVSIGPLHSKDEHLQSPMQDVKLWYVNFLLCRITDGSFACKLAVFEKCIEAMNLLLVDAKKSYTEEVDNLNEEMLVVDGCFILELLYRYYLMINNTQEKPNEKSEVNTNALPKGIISDPVFDNPLTSIAVRHDLLLLENQLPLCVLEKLFHITVAKIQHRPRNYTLFDYVILYFSHVNSQGGKSTTSNATNCCLPGECVVHMKSNEVYYHMLHIVHDHSLPCELPKGEYYSGLMPSASNLDYAGVKFGAGTGENLFKVKFTKVKSCLLRCFHIGCFKISTLSLDDSTEIFLRNLIAFEQGCPGVSGYFTSYAILMDKLVDSEKDVKVLQKAGIIQNNLGTNQEASDLFNKLCKEVVLGKFYFAEECKQATDYSNHRWPAFVAHVRREYLATPWTFIAFCVAFIAFGMGVVQFILSFFEVSYAVDEYSVSM